MRKLIQVLNKFLNNFKTNGFIFKQILELYYISYKY